MDQDVHQDALDVQDHVEIHVHQHVQVVQVHVDLVVPPVVVGVQADVEAAVQENVRGAQVVVDHLVLEHVQVVQVVAQGVLDVVDVVHAHLDVHQGVKVVAVTVVLDVPLVVAVVVEVVRVHVPEDAEDHVRDVIVHAQAIVYRHVAIAVQADARDVHHVQAVVDLVVLDAVIAQVSVIHHVPSNVVEPVMDVLTSAPLIAIPIVQDVEMDVTAVLEVVAGMDVAHHVQHALLVQLVVDRIALDVMDAQ